MRFGDHQVPEDWKSGFFTELCPQLTDTGCIFLPAKIILEADSDLPHVLSSSTKCSKKVFHSAALSDESIPFLQKGIVKW